MTSVLHVTASDINLSQVSINTTVRFCARQGLGLMWDVGVIKEQTHQGVSKPRHWIDPNTVTDHTLDLTQTD